MQQALNELETKVIGALAEIGLLGESSEHSFPGGPANSRVIFSDGTDSLIVNATPTEIHNGSYILVSERTIAGTVVQTIEYASGGPIRDAFLCDAVLYESAGPRPPGFGDFDELLSALIGALGCVQAGELPPSR